MENNVVETVVENPVVDIPVEVTAVKQGIEPVQVPVPVIDIPTAETKTFLGMDERSWKDVGVSTGLVLTGVAIDRLVPWGYRKIKNGIKKITNAIANAKDDSKNEAQPAAQPTQPQEAPAQPNTTPVNQENK